MENRECWAVGQATACPTPALVGKESWQVREEVDMARRER